MLIALEFAISLGLSWKLSGMVADRLDAELRIKSLWYIPPVGMWVSGASLYRDEERLVEIGPTKLRLARIPWFNKPLIIQSLDVDDPVIEISRTEQGLMGGPGLVKARPIPPKPRPPKKLSDILRLRKFILNRGKIVYTDVRPAPAGGEPLPMTWNDINVNIDLDRKSESNYSYSLKAHTGQLGDLSGGGTFDVDELMLKVDDLRLKLAANPNAQRSPLPAPVQRFIQKYEVAGALTATASATLPLRDIDHAEYVARLELADGTAWMPEFAVAIEKAHAIVEIEKRGEQLIVRLVALDAASGNARIQMDGGKVFLDLAEGRWVIGDVSGHVTMEGVASEQLNPRDLVRKLQPAGRVDFTATGSGPIEWLGKTPKANVADYQIMAYPRDVSFSYPRFPKRFENVSGGNVRLQYGIITFENLSARYGNDQVRVTSARLPLAGLPGTVRYQEINGSVTFNSPLEDYPEPLMKVFRHVTPSGNYMVAGSVTINRRERPAKFDYDLQVCSDSAGMMLVDWHIPLSRVRTDLAITPSHVIARNLEASCLDGQLTLSGQWNRGEHSSYKGSVGLSDARLERVSEVLREAGKEMRDLSGSFYVRGAFEGEYGKEKSAADALRASGELEIIRGNFFHIPVLRELVGSIQGLRSISTAGEAATSFSIHDRTVTLSDTAISSPLVGIQGGGDIGFDGSLNLRAIVAPLADWQDKIKETNIPIVSDIAGEIVGGVQKLLNSATSALLYQFRIEGTIKEPKITPIPAPALTESAAFVFGKMLQGMREGELRPTVKRATTYPSTTQK